MTLILSAYANGWSFQASDRRLSVFKDATTQEPVYAYANKSLIVQTVDAVVTIGFTGLAHLRSEPTDAWIAGCLLQEIFDEDGVSRWQLGRRRLHQLVADLRRELAVALALAPTPRQGGALLLRLEFAGQRFDRGSRRSFSPIMLSVEAERVHRSTVTRVVSHASRHRWLSGEDPQMLFSSPPSRGMKNWLDTQLGAAKLTRPRFREILVEALRLCARHSGSSVGEDCMLVEFQPQIRGRTRAWVEFFPKEAPAPSILMGGKTVPLAFTPGILAPGGYIRPGVQNMDSVLHPYIELNVKGLPEFTGLPLVGYRGDLVQPRASDIARWRHRRPPLPGIDAPFAHP